MNNYTSIFTVSDLNKWLNDSVVLEPTKSTYPPYNLIKVADDSTLIEIAVAGFQKDNINVSKDKLVLTVEGYHAKVSEEDTKNKEYYHRGISGKDFKIRFQLAQYVEVISAEIVDGILKILLEKHIPEEAKPKTIKIK